MRARKDKIKTKAKCCCQLLRALQSRQVEYKKKTRQDKTSERGGGGGGRGIMRHETGDMTDET
jgi:hypothetical protein